MDWKQCVIPVTASYETFEDGICLLARAHGYPAELALLTRTTADRRSRVLLLSPLAAKLAGDDLCPSWKDCDGPELFEWDVVIGPEDACERLGLNRPVYREPARRPVVAYY
jgi:hypothetical protein